MYEFRRYKKKQGKSKFKHPKLIVFEEGNQYGYMGLTSRKSKGRGHNNIKLSVNPEFGKTKASYLRKKVEFDDKRMFSRILDNYKLSEKDKKFIIEYINKHKKR